MNQLRRAVFLDRDGVISVNREDYVKSWEEFSFLPDIFEPLQKLARSDYLVVVTSNQSAVGRDLMAVKTLEDIHKRMKDEITRQGGRLDGIYYCPHRPDEACDCRKPRPGMLFAAARDLNLDLANSFFIGDSRADVEAALNAGASPLLVLTGRGQDQISRMPADILEHCRVFANLAAAVEWLLNQ